MKPPDIIYKIPLKWLFLVTKCDFRRPLLRNFEFFSAKFYFFLKVLREYFQELASNCWYDFYFSFDKIPKIALKIGKKSNLKAPPTQQGPLQKNFFLVFGVSGPKGTFSVGSRFRILKNVISRHTLLLVKIFIRVLVFTCHKIQ